MEQPNPREKDESVLLEFSMRQRLFVCFFLFCFGRAEAKTSPLLISDGCCEQWRGGPLLTCSLWMVVAAVCGLHQEMLRSSKAGGLVGGLICHVNI